MWHNLEAVLKSSRKDGSTSRVMVREEDVTLWEIQVSRLARWSDCLHKLGDQSIRNQLEMVWREEEEKEEGEEKGEEEDTW